MHDCSFRMVLAPSAAAVTHRGWFDAANLKLRSAQHGVTGCKETSVALSSARFAASTSAFRCRCEQEHTAVLETGVKTQWALLCLLLTCTAHNPL